MWGDLPPDGYQIVAQLLVWSPNDDRLYWQLGELLNAMGSVQDAFKRLRRAGVQPQRKRGPGTSGTPQHPQGVAATSRTQCNQANGGRRDVPNGVA